MNLKFIGVLASAYALSLFVIVGYSNHLMHIVLPDYIPPVTLPAVVTGGIWALMSWVGSWFYSLRNKPSLEEEFKKTVDMALISLKTLGNEAKMIYGEIRGLNKIVEEVTLQRDLLVSTTNVLEGQMKEIGSFLFRLNAEREVRKD